MKRRIFTLFLLILCLVTSSVAYANVDLEMEYGALPALDPLKMSEEELEIYKQALAQYDGAIINDRLMTAFKEEFGEKDGFPARYPDDFAGTYLDESGKLVIQISSDNNTKLINSDYSSYIDINKIKEYDDSFKADRFSDVVIYEQVKYSLNQLNVMMNDAITTVSKDFPVMSGYVDTFNNSIVLEIDHEVFDKANDIDTRIAQYKEEQPEKDIPLKIQPAKARELIANHLGGQGNYIHGDAVSVTLGFTGWYNGYKSYLSCGHNAGFSAGDTAKYGGSIIGYVTTKQWQTNTSGDWSIIGLNSSETISGLIKQNYSGTVTGKIKSRTNTPTLNQIVYTFGNKTQVWSSYKVTDVSLTTYTFDSAANSYYTIKGITDAKLITGTMAASGDSGSPIVIATTGGFSALGIAHAVSTTDSLLSFSPMTHVPSNFVVEIGY
jgi:hypothetical protein